MKKSRLITSLCLLVLTFACLTFGVYSAIKTSFTASGSITFNAYECDVTIDGKIEGAIQKEGGATLQTTYKGASKSGHDGYTAGTNGAIPTWEMGDMAFDELNGGDQITIIITVSNYSAYAVVVSMDNGWLIGLPNEEINHINGQNFELAAASGGTPVSNSYQIQYYCVPLNEGQTVDAGSFQLNINVSITPKK